MTALPKWSLALVAGLIFPLGFSPFDLWPLIPVSAGTLYALLRNGATHPGRIGWVYGLGAFGVGVSWVYVSIHVYGNTAIWLAGTLTALFCGGLALLFALQTVIFQRWALQRGLLSVVHFAALWVLFEWLRSWLLTGFPWLYAGYGALHDGLDGWIPVVGVYGCSFLLVALGAAVSEVTLGASRRRTAAIVAAVGTILVAIGIGFRQIDWTTPTGDPLAVALVQPNTPLAQKWDRRYLDSILTHFEQTNEALSQHHALIIWPESALPSYRDRILHVIETVDAHARAAGTSIITGVPSRQSGSAFNSIEALGNGSGIYHKQKLVPFGEYVPLASWLRGLIGFFDLPMSQFAAGPDEQTLLRAGAHDVATLICYEVVYPDFVATMARQADLLVTVSNDTWFGNSSGPWQHFQMARFRAAELGKNLLRSTNDGVSAIVDHRGQVRVSAGQFTESVIVGQVEPRSGLTPFARTGSAPVLTLCFLALLLGRRRRDYW